MGRPCLHERLEHLLDLGLSRSACDALASAFGKLLRGIKVIIEPSAAPMVLAAGLTGIRQKCSFEVPSCRRPRGPSKVRAHARDCRLGTTDAFSTPIAISRFISIMLRWRISEHSVNDKRPTAAHGGVFGSIRRRDAVR